MKARSAAAAARRDEAAAAVDTHRRAADAARQRRRRWPSASDAMRHEPAMRRRRRSSGSTGSGRCLPSGAADLEPLALARARRRWPGPSRAWPRCPIRRRLAPRSRRRAAAARAAGEAVADARAASATRARETAAERERHAAAGREAGEWRTRGLRPRNGWARAAARAASLAEERGELAGEPERQAAEIEQFERDAAASESEVAAHASEERDAEQAVAIAARALADAGEGFAAAREARAGASARAEAQAMRRQEFARASGERFECPPPLLPERIGFDADALGDPEAEKEALDRSSAERERIGPVNLVAEEELAELDSNRVAGAAEREELGQAIARLRGSIGSLNREGRVRLLEAYEKVDAHFQSLFATLFNGGQAHLALVESDDPLEAGLEIMAQPPGKRLTALTLLSGGEQALTAVALIFALFLTNPAPICVLDEVDAPLDDANVDRFCGLLDRMSRETDTRYLIVTHNAVTMSRMHRLYGVTMIEQGVSRLVSVDLGGAEELLAAE